MKRLQTGLILLAVLLAALPLAAAGRNEVVDIETPEFAQGPSSYDSRYPSAIFAGGCFWGVEAMFETQPGVLDAVSGYTGGDLEFPTYGRVLSGQTGHVEAVAVWYDPEVTSYRELAKYFFEIHDPTQTDGQGPDIGSQYLSVIFYENEAEKATAQELISILEGIGYDVATRVEERSTFYRAEGYHQNYYARSSSTPYCHFYTPRFP